MQTVMPANVGKVKLYRDDVPLFSRFQIEHQIESAYGRHVNLPSGGAIVIDHTEALVAIDVNSARATKGHDIEETAFRTNLEAAEEVARQLRLRDLGGLIVVDFIDMESQKNQREVETCFRDSLRHDRARVQIGKISRFGLMELSRQRLQPSLEETAHISCPRCGGTGFIRGTESTALHVLRIIQEEAMKENTGAVHAQVPVDVASFLLNEKRAEIQKLEARIKVNIVLVPNAHLETPHYKVQRLKHDELNQMEHVPTSYELVEQPDEPKALGKDAEPKKERQLAAVQGIVPDQPAPIVAEPLPRSEAARAAAPAPAAPAATESARSGFLGRLFGWLKSEKPADQPAAANEPSMRQARPPRPERSRDESRNRQDHRRGERGGRRDGQPRGDRDGRRDHQPRGDRDAKRDQPRGDRDGRRDQQPRRDQQRPPQQQQPRQDRPQAERPQGEIQQQGELLQVERQPSERPQGERRPDQRPPRQPQQQQQRPQQPGQDGTRPPPQEGEEPRRGRRNRGGRGRGGGGDRGDRPDRGERQPQQQGQGPEQSLYAQQLEEHRLKQQREAESHEADAQAHHEPAPQPASQPSYAPAPRMEEQVREEAPRAEAPRFEAPRVEEPRVQAPRVEAPRVDPKEILASAGLQMVETDSSKARQPAPEPERVQLGRPRREKPAIQPASEELVQVETRDK